MRQGSWPLRIIAAAAITAAIGAIAFFAYTLVLRTDYKNTALEINDAVLAYGNEAVICQGDTQLKASSQIVNYYDRFLLASRTQVYSRKNKDTDDRTIFISLGPDRLSFTEGEDGWVTCISWETPEKNKSFRVRSQTTFMQLEAYFQNYKRKA